ncbi:class I SAM-dependent methyltransferase [Roseibium denhamense]|uniref:class I SAM-dependent methyltransferase n=1 Tax=Roseibium denhamense TaxID=76305 RepID=UPI0012BD6610|nr:class I SAM-dependent methyltransferase [Roseibium denhamense]MTI06898.1 class I SAM-dependent methyltransferase [Roseibium denhamense]
MTAQGKFVPSLRETAGARDALSFFRNEWNIYQKIVQSNAMHHRDLASLLGAVISKRFAVPFHFFDLACGDGVFAKSVLHGLPVARYQGVDLNENALMQAAETFKNCPYDFELHHGDMVAWVNRNRTPADVMWCGFSLHNLKTCGEKQALFSAIYQSLKPGGLFACVEPTCHAGESREHYLARTRPQVRSRFAALDDQEFSQMWAHISEHDHPETVQSWLSMGVRAGFETSREIYRMPGDLFCAAYLFEKPARRFTQA